MFCRYCIKCLLLRHDHLQHLCFYIRLHSRSLRRSHFCHLGRSLRAKQVDKCIRPLTALPRSCLISGTTHSRLVIKNETDCLHTCILYGKHKLDQNLTLNYRFHFFTKKYTTDTVLFWSISRAKQYISYYYWRLYWSLYNHMIYLYYRNSTKSPLKSRGLLSIS